MTLHEGWEQQKRDLETEERVLFKVASLFSASEKDEVFALFEELGELRHPRLMLDILRGVELGKGSDAIEKLKRLIALAKCDARDIWVIECRRHFNAAFGISKEELLELQAEDAREHLEWLMK